MTTDPLDRIAATGVIAVLRGIDPAAVPSVVEAIVDGGVDVVEITADSPAAVDAIETIEADFDDVLVGAGTVLDAEVVRRLTDAGAEFIVSPTTDETVIQAGHLAGVPVAPGAFTPTEVHRANRAGADLVKVFPASTGGPGHLRSLGGPLSGIDLLPTGGIDATNAGAYVEAGAVAVGVGGGIVDHKAIAAGTFDVIRANASDVVAAVEAART